MASGLDRTRARAYIDDSLGTSTRTAPTTPMKLQVCTVAGTENTAGTALGSTTAQTIAFGAASNANPPVASSTGTTTITAGASGTVVSIEINDSAGTPVRAWFGALTANRTVVAGDSLVFAAASVTAQLTPTP